METQPAKQKTQSVCVTVNALMCVPVVCELRTNTLYMSWHAIFKLITPFILIDEIPVLH